MDILPSSVLPHEILNNFSPLCFPFALLMRDMREITLVWFYNTYHRQPLLKEPSNIFNRALGSLNGVYH